MVRYQFLRRYWVGVHLTELEERPESLDWTYTVDRIDGDLVHVSAEHFADSGPLPWSFVFETSGRLVSAEVAGAVHHEPADEPFVDLRSLRYEYFVKEWPRFPLEEPYGEEGDDLRQSVIEEGPGGRLSVEVVRRGEDTSGEKKKKRVMVQQWEPGRPWWTSVVIRSEWHSGMEKTELEGEVIAWTR